MSLPIITVGITLSPPTVTLGVPCSLTVSATLSPSYPSPITIYTRMTVFNVTYAQRRGAFFCNDLSDNNAPLRLRSVTCTKPAYGISREFGGRDDHLFHTLEPGRTVNFTEPLILSTHPNGRLIVGNNYRFGVGPEPPLFDESGSHELGRWLLGRREEVLSKPGEDGSSIDWHPGFIELVMPDPIEFEVLGSKDPDVSTQQTSSSLG